MRVICISPSLNPVGGVAKILDYTVHSSLLGYETIFAYDNASVGKKILMTKPYFKKNKDSITFVRFSDLKPQDNDIIFYSLPLHHKMVEKKYEFHNHNLIHIIQNVRHSNIFFEGGYSVELLGLEQTRISITEQVYNAINNWVIDSKNHFFVPHGFDFDFFKKKPLKRKSSKVVAYNSFKGDLGKKIRNAFYKAGGKAKFIEIPKGVSWKKLKSIYHQSDIFLATPLAEEGLYLPAMEAMAAGNLVITPNAIGNLFYCDFGINCLEVRLNNIDNYVRVLFDQLNVEETDHVFNIRQKAYDKVKNLGLEKEREGFDKVLKRFVES